ncbi:hypothetical protein [Rhodovulum euryhalinum]|uniref:Muramidase (Phage lysozyme) n=1 Tax=Rhodovulum euryhalinum TaxID=35805 RepID=A0A4R2KFV4_9RHOB|nr:hypothetical protein [Rhodovulum euryhalinum]TCO72473.1 hypothetical protein EV655_104161 [Rhodovulum euryhalinum]
MILRGQALALLLIAAIGALPRGGAAQAVSLLGDGGLFAARGALVAVRNPDPSTGGGASLFAGREGASLFAPLPPRAEPLPAPGAAQRPVALPLTGARGFFAERIRDLIAKAEAGPKGYDAVQHGARIGPPRRPTDMTIGDIYAWIKATPGQPHAIGRYQFIPSTLRRLVAELGLDERTRFSPAVQDRLADVLLEDAGLSDLLAGAIDRRAFMNNLARIWAGFPNSSGKSHYHGLAGNRATMSWAQFETQMGRIFPG